MLLLHFAAGAAPVAAVLHPPLHPFAEIQRAALVCGKKVQISMSSGCCDQQVTDPPHPCHPYTHHPTPPTTPPNPRTLARPPVSSSSNAAATSASLRSAVPPAAPLFSAHSRRNSSGER